MLFVPVCNHTQTKQLQGPFYVKFLDFELFVMTTLMQKVRAVEEQYWREECDSYGGVVGRSSWM